MKKLLFALLALIMFSCQSAQTPLNIEAADAAYDRFELKKSRKILMAMLDTDSLDTHVRCKALQRLAFQDAKYYHDFKQANIRLLEADSLEPDNYKTWMYRSRIEHQSGSFLLSAISALKAQELAHTEQEINDALTARVHAMFMNILADITLSKPTDSIQLAVGIRQLGILRSHLDKHSGQALPSKLLLGIGLVRNQGSEVMEAWKSYFHIQDLIASPAYLMPAAEALQEVCNNMQGGPMRLSLRDSLIAALGASRFYEMIPMLIKVHPGAFRSGPHIYDIVLYSDYLEEIKTRTNEYYRQIALGKESQRKYRKYLDTKKKQLWDQLSFGSPVAYSKEAFQEAMLKHFGARGFEGSTSSYDGYNLCLGHIINQEQAQVQQYGYAPEFTLTEIDLMTSNTFPSWYWEDKASGGWATDTEIIRVREAYLKRPFAEWNTVADSLGKIEAEERNQDFLQLPTNATQLELSAGLERKLNHDASTDLYNKLISEGLQGNELKLAFLSTYRTYRKEASIMAHEGRHSIEKKYMPEAFEKWDNAEREYHAKLSQLIFATEPRYELAGMLDDIGDSGHGKANKQIINILTTWIEKHNKEVKGYTKEKSTYAQIHLLTPKQIRTCCKEADPMNPNRKQE